MRSVTQEEMEEKNSKAVEFFQTAREVNRRARSLDEMDSTVAEVRRLRAERTLKELQEAERKAKEEKEKLEPPKKPTMAALLMRRASAISETPSASSAAEDSTAAAAAEEANPDPVKKKSLIAQFGYGVKPNQTASQKLKGAALAIHSLVKVKKAGFSAANVPENTLFQRLESSRQERAASK
jgi:hypothetical protein